MDRYGEEIEADLHQVYHLDLVSFFRGEHSRRKLVRLVNQLPPRSRFGLARLEDDDLADQYLEQLENSPAGGPALVDWTPEVAELVHIQEQLMHLRHTVIGALGGKPGRVKPLPRPRTALDRARTRRAKRKHEELVREVEAARERAKVEG